MIYLLSQLVHESARRDPDRDAYRSGNKTVSYREMASTIDRIASTLVTCGLKKGDRVGVYLHRCLESPLAVHGIMRAGGIFVPFDPYAPAGRARQIVEDCGIRFMISVDQHANRLAELGNMIENELTVLGLENCEAENIQVVTWSEILRASDEFVPPRMLDSDVAYIMYTSGTTGVPKGIMHTHASGLAYARLSAELYDVKHDDVIGSHAPLYVDMSTFAYLTAPFAGATTIIVPDAYTKLPASLSGLIEKEKITIWYSVPLVLTQLLENGILDARNMDKLRWVLYGGEPLAAKYIAALMQFWPNASFSNVYGPAEVNQCTYFNMHTPPEIDAPIPLGHIWDNTSALVIDEDDKEVDEGEIGELLVRSVTMMAGYWGKPNLTTRSGFLAQGLPGYSHRYYRTGDLVRYNHKGQLMFHGRKDRQVKIHGYRIELDEIEAGIGSHESVAEIAVVAVKGAELVRTLKAYVHLTPGSSIGVDEVATYARERLPSYGVPTEWEFSGPLPRTSAGKVDHKALAERSKQSK